MRRICARKTDYGTDMQRMSAVDVFWHMRRHVLFFALN